jgi:hypothetical protein
MVNMLPSLALPLLPIVWALIATAYWWRHLSSHGLFFVTALLALFGVQAIVSFAWESWPQLFGSYFLEPNNFVGGVAPSEADIQRHLEAKNQAAAIQAAVVFVAAIPFLWWLKSGLASE